MQFGWLMTHIAVAAGVLAGWLNPIFGLMIYYAFSILRPSDLWFWNEWPIKRLSYYVALSTLLGWLVNGFGRSEGLKGIGLPVFGLVLYLLAGVIAWRLTDVSEVRAWNALTIQLKIGLMALVTLTLIRDQKSIFTFAYVLTGALGYLGWVFNSQYYFDGWNRIWPNGFGGVDNNGVAMIMVMGVPLSFFIAINSGSKIVKGMCFFSAAMMVHVVLLSFSRGGQLGLVMVGMAIFTVALIKLPRKHITISMAIVMVMFTLHYAGPEVRDRFWSIFVDPEARDASAQSRLLTWKAAWQCIKDNPLGVGPRNFNLIASQYGLLGQKSIHNLFLQTGADYGIMGMIGLTIFYLSTMYKTFVMTTSRVAKRLEWPRYFGHMVCISLAGFLVCSIFVGMESVETSYVIALIGLCTVSYVTRHGELLPKDERIPEFAEVPAPGDFEDHPIPVA
ncbi:MAG: hypothetical protein CMJ18_07190 [Phycisphaeraceae bacterium]|nr:hypothetical protein [Phycisphaeraceae bacterium]